MIKEIVFNILKDVIGKTSVPLSLVLILWFILTPAYNNVIQLMNTVEAHEKKIEKLDVIDDKLTAIMIELGIQKEKIFSIERRYDKQKTGE